MIPTFRIVLCTVASKCELASHNPVDLKAEISRNLGLYSKCGWAYYRKISQSIEAARFMRKHFDVRLDNSAAEMQVTFQSDTTNIAPNIVT